MRPKEALALIMIIGGAVLSASFLYAADGGEPGAFLKRGMGVRALTLGKSYVAIADDSTSVYWNPAGLAQVRRPEVSLMHSKPFQGIIGGIDYHTLSYAQPIGEGTFGAGLVSLDVGGMEKYNEAGERVGTFQNIERAFFLSYGHKLRDTIFIGASLKGVHHQIDKYSATGYGLDLASLYQPYPKLKIGLMLQDVIGPNVNLAGRGAPFPLKAHLGLAYRMGEPDWLNESGILFTVGTVIADGKVVRPKGGIEFQITRLLSIRGGYDASSDEIGAGVGIRAGRMGLDYSCNTHQRLRETHKVSLSFRY